ncbi:MAG: hypothetical protein JWN01_842 [Patescibacteria group bacterium]|nr:hypothetical protein [Patescibacteria group bacterium]
MSIARFTCLAIAFVLATSPLASCKNAPGSTGAEPPTRANPAVEQHDGDLARDPAGNYWLLFEGPDGRGNRLRIYTREVLKACLNKKKPNGKRPNTGETDLTSFIRLKGGVGRDCGHP